MNKRKLKTMVGEHSVRVQAGLIRGDVQLSNSPTLLHLPGLGEDLFVVPPRSTDTVFGFGDLSQAMRISGTTSTSIALPAAGQTDSFIEATGIRRSTQAIEGMVREIAGDGASISLAIESDEDDDQLLIGVQWPEDDESVLVVWTDVLMARVAREVPAADRARITIIPLVSRADQAG
jgi:hypothetical protein